MDTLKICPKCNYLGADTDTTCPACGIKLISQCPQCGARIKTPFAEYCYYCGIRFETVIGSHNQAVAQKPERSGLKPQRLRQSKRTPDSQTKKPAKRKLKK